MIRSFLKYVSLNATICHSCSVASISAAVSWTESISGSLRAFCQSILKKSLQNAFPIFKCFFRKMKSRYKMQRMPSYYKNSAGIRFCCMNSPGNRGWYPARAHPFSSENGKGLFQAQSQGSKWQHATRLAHACCGTARNRSQHTCKKFCHIQLTSSLRENVVGLRLSRRQQWDAWYTWPTKSRCD